jgi:hypothetical protein
MEDNAQWSNSPCTSGVEGWLSAMKVDPNLNVSQPMHAMTQHNLHIVHESSSKSTRHDQDCADLVAHEAQSAAATAMERVIESRTVQAQPRTKGSNSAAVLLEVREWVKCH